MSKHIILFLAANPLGTTELALGREARAIQEELERSGQRDRFEFVTRWAAQPLDLIRELRKLKPTVVHFSGHGGSGRRPPGDGPRQDIEVEVGGDGGANHSDGTGGLCFQGPDGRPQLVTSAALREAFGSVEACVKLVVLNACYSDIYAEALLVHIDCVVGMGGSLQDDAARAFAIGFYGGLGERQSVAAAYLQGCAAISLEQPPDNERPRLRVRNGVNADQLVLAGTNAVGRGRPIPAYPNAEVEQLSKRLDDARARRDKLRGARISAEHLDREILDLRRQLREGGQLRAGDALSDGRYLLVKVVGQGGFAVVWEAYDCAMQQRVAIKVLHTNLGGDPLRRERFFRGAQAMIRLAHPAVVRVLEPKAEDGGFYYFVMEYVPGGNLRETVLGRRVKNEDVLPLIFRIGEVLVLAHSQGMIHRDVKPANILLDEHGHAKLTDFDLVGACDTTGGTRTGALGTVVYAAPECLERPQEATARADVYSLGMTVIFCLSGRELSLSTFKNPESTIAMLRCSNHIREVLRRAVTWEPSARFEDARKFMAELQRAAGQHPADDVRGSIQDEMNGARGTHFGPVSRTSEQQDRLPHPELGHSTQSDGVTDLLERLLSSIPVYGTIVSVSAGLGVVLAMSGFLLIGQGVNTGLIISGIICAGFGLSVVYIAARSVSDRMRAFAAVSHRGSRFRERATVVAIVAGVGLVATLLFAALTSSLRAGH